MDHYLQPARALPFEVEASPYCCCFSGLPRDAESHSVVGRDKMHMSIVDI